MSEGKQKKLTKPKFLLQELKKLEIEDGVLTPRAVVSAAKPVDSPLHKYFEWNNSIAGERYRLWQARHLINEITVEVEGKELSGYHSISVEINGSKQKAYFSVDRVIREPKLFDEVLKEAVEELEYWDRKYSNLSELEGVLNKKKLSRVKRKTLST